MQYTCVCRFICSCCRIEKSVELYIYVRRNPGCERHLSQVYDIIITAVSCDEFVLECSLARIMPPNKY
jgi:hypothetical protein